MSRLGGIWLAVILAAALALAGPSMAGEAYPPPGFVDAASVVPGLVVEMRYCGPHNFTGRPVPGYQAPRCLLTWPAARSLAKVQAELGPLGLGVKVYDCYRPQTAVNAFEAWARDLDDKLTQAEFYPTVPKAELFKRGYIAARSSHSRGSTVDLTIVPLPQPPQEKYAPGQKLVACTEPAGRRFRDNSLDMGTGFDCFSPMAHTANPRVGSQQRANRLLLVSLMAKHGFKNLDLEWWHYTLLDEPFPDTYFDFPVR
eukprot:TRINITY_DN8167_c1_g1_i1.p2 TRINITY_DN8167_c1_g1~~TRINITY_DN8167_c1_g1_i1.p2  ORF type:complete len:256 (+),score=88.36 TRINITY_DN8167_c1_g1_i1:853-1620(+)